MPITLRNDASDYKRRALEARLWDIGPDAPAGLGCHTCIDREVCGMLRLKSGLFDCSEFCCGSPTTCTSRMCRFASKEFARRHMEIGGFRLRNVPAAPVLEAASFPRTVPIIYHGNRRTRRLQVEAAGLKLSQLYNAKRGEPRYATELCVNLGDGPAGT